MGGSTGTGAPAKMAEAPGEGGPEGFKVSLVLFDANDLETIRAADAALATIAARHEILVVAGKDGPADAVRAAAANNPRIRLLPRCGLAAALQAAELDLVALAPAGWKPEAAELTTLLPLTRAHDVVRGACAADRGWLARGYDALAGLLLGVRDGGALKIVHRTHVGLLLPDCKNAFADTEMLTRAGRAGLAVAEVGLNRPAARSVRQPWRESGRALASLVRFWWARILYAAPDCAPGAARGPLWAPLLLLALIAGALLFPYLSYPLLEPDEGRYAEIGREMLARGDWVVPTLNHEPYYDKPPLLYWLVAASLHLFGTCEWAARLVPTGATFLTILATFFFARRNLGSRIAFLSALALALMPAFMQCGRSLILDSLLALLVSLSLFTAYEAIKRPRLHWGWWLASAACCALAVLTKGPVALVLLGPPVVVCAWLHRDGARPGLRAWCTYLAVVLGLAAPWFLAFSARDASFAYQFFVQHHLMRYLGEDFHAGPVWFYLPILFIGCLPWSCGFPGFVRFLFARSAAAAALRPRAMGFCLLWAGWCLLFFSMSRGKLPPYILPALPGLAVLIGCYLEPVLAGVALGRLLEGARLLAPRLAVGTLAALWLGAAAWFWARGLTTTHLLLAEAVLCLAFLAGTLGVGRRLTPRMAWGVCAGFCFAFLLAVSNELVPAWAARCSPLPRRADVGQWLDDPETAVVVWGDEWGSVAFRLERAGMYLSTTHCAPEAVPRFLGKHRCNLVIGKDELELAHLQSVAPAGMEVRQLASYPRTRVFLVSVSAPQARAAHGSP